MVINDKGVAAVVDAAIERRGISIAELARRTDMTPDALSRSRAGERAFRGNELLSVMEELELTLHDFQVGDENDG